MNDLLCVTEEKFCRQLWLLYLSTDVNIHFVKSKTIVKSPQIILSKN
jgi:hypothetical protein